jgi:hypothetical protein
MTVPEPPPVPAELEAGEALPAAEATPDDDPAAGTAALGEELEGEFAEDDAGVDDAGVEDELQPIAVKANPPVSASPSRTR